MGSTNIAKRSPTLVTAAHQAFAFQISTIGTTLLEMVAKRIKTIIDGSTNPQCWIADVAIRRATTMSVVPVAVAVGVAKTAARQAAGPGPGARRTDGIVARSASNIALYTESATAIDTATLTRPTHGLGTVTTSLHAVGAQDGAT